MGGTLAEARSLWTKLRKSEVIDTAIESAEIAAPGVEAGLRNAFATLYRQRDSKKMRGFTADELAAIKAVAQGNVTSNVLRRIGSLSGGIDQSRNLLNMLGGIGAGAYVGGPVGAVAVPALAYGAQKAAKAGTQNRAAMARATVARGETPKQATVPKQRTPTEQFLIDGMKRRYPSGAGPGAAAAVGLQRYQDDPWRRGRR